MFSFIFELIFVDLGYLSNKQFLYPNFFGSTTTYHLIWIFHT
nr:MAG TPA: hypothetical protein [Caudoviricetes sp.]